ncbi:serine/threonine protein kinase [Actinokineospora inagensis]|uniref:serine/threonine protein kinase n=1 Tax=Actinokineospora inagensis TaxID=103730 RepID=UPI00040958E8|nr:serine/threonine-protein kinase [Actinokineospora inagensis]
MSAPPIPGLVFVRFLGSGGFAEVHLYRQAEPKREVAVKVLKAVGRFTAEADAMAELGDHPHIAQVFYTGITADGRSYLVMPYYPRPNFAERARTERIGVGEALQVGVKIANAVQSAHAVGILHRDIKPANVLVDRLGEPRLADFGIAGRVAAAHGADGVLMSVPWSPPEVLRGEPSTFQSDVYSLGATVWHLLAGRSPFEVPDGDNGVDALVRRIETTPAKTTGRPGVPDALEQVLLRAMAPDPADRFGTAREFALALRAVEQSGVFPEQTTVLPPRPVAKPDPVAETRSRPVEETRARVRPNGAARPPAYVDPPKNSRPAPVEPVATTVARPPKTVASDTVNERERRPWAALTLGAVALVAAAVTGAVLLSGTPASRQPTAPADPGVRDQNAGGLDAPPGKPTISATRVDAATLRFRWTYSAQFATDSYVYRTADSSRSETATTPSVDISAPAGTRVCLQVKVVRADGGNGSADWSPPGCGV